MSEIKSEQTTPGKAPEAAEVVKKSKDAKPKLKASPAPASQPISGTAPGTPHGNVPETSRKSAIDETMGIFGWD